MPVAWDLQTEYHEIQTRRFHLLGARRLYLSLTLLILVLAAQYPYRDLPDIENYGDTLVTQENSIFYAEYLAV